MRVRVREEAALDLREHRQRGEGQHLMAASHGGIDLIAPKFHGLLESHPLLAPQPKERVFSHL